MWRLTANPAQARRGPWVAGVGWGSQRPLEGPRRRDEGRPDRREERVRNGQRTPDSEGVLCTPHPFQLLRNGHRSVTVSTSKQLESPPQSFS